jgi:diguanylate cyclase (GGDEF)-like protein
MPRDGFQRPSRPADPFLDMDETRTSGRLPARVGLLALLHGAGGLFCVVGALEPMSPDTPVALIRVLAVVGLLVAATLVAVRDRLPVAGQHAALATLSLLAGLLAARSATAVGIVGLAPVLICVGLYGAHFLSLPAARVHALLAVGAGTAGAVAATPSGFAAPWLIGVVSTLALTEVYGRLDGRLRADASTDALTGVANRRAWEAEATRSLARAARSGEPLTVAILDLDGFKQVNDRDGHSAGDRLLREVAGEWRTRLRSSDLLGRHGGDEFVLCLPDTDGPGAREVLERLDGGLPIGWSVGTATASSGDSLTTLLERADAQLYRGKRLRRGAPRD